MNKKLTTLSVALGALALTTACQDYDLGNTVKEITYNETFEDAFGKIDPNQDWSMATTVTANVNVSGASSKCVVSLYTDKPIYASSKGIAMFQGTSAQFDAIKGLEQVFAIVYEGGNEIAHGFYNVVDGTVNINDTPVSRCESLTRASSSCTATKGKVYKDFFTGAKGTAKYVWDKASLKSNVIVAEEDGFFFPNFNGSSKVWGWGELCTLVQERNNSSYTFPFKNTCYVDNAWNFTNETFLNDPFDATASYIKVNKNDLIWWVDQSIGYQKFTESELKTYVEEHNMKNDGPYANCWSNGDINIDLTSLTGVETSSAQPWSLEIGYNLFGPNGFFCEQNYYWGPKTTTFDKTTLYGSTEAEKLETMKKIESGFSITTKAGTVVDVPFIYGATQIPDIFGYVYYKDGQDPLTQPHYMLMQNGTPTANIFYNVWSTGKAVGAMELAGWASATPETPLSGLSKSTNVYGTKYTLAFFGADHKQPAKHEFDAGYHIVFFISNTTKGEPTMPNCGNFNYSLPELNERLGHLYGEDNKKTSGGTLTYKKGVNPAGSVKAAAWNYKGSVFMGFEDGGQDEDLNDIVFWVEGDFESNDIVTVKTVEEQMTTSWIFAAEDLGGTFDYDFNDVVWEVAQTNSHKTVTRNAESVADQLEYGNIKINVLASGGTLPVELVYNNEVLSPAGKSEIHQLFGQEAADLYVPVNAGSSADKQKVTLKEIPASAALNISNFSSKFKLKVSGADGEAHYVTSPEKGETKKAPQVILLPADWEWPTESTPITTAYPDFTSWVNNATWAQWSAKKAGPTTKRGVITGTANGTTITETTETTEIVPTNPEPTRYSVYVSANNNAYGTVAGGGSHPEGANITISATPTSGYRFVKWNDENTSNPRSITVSSDASYTAIFEEIPEDGITLLWTGSLVAAYNDNAALDLSALTHFEKVKVGTEIRFYLSVIDSSTGYNFYPKTIGWVDLSTDSSKFETKGYISHTVNNLDDVKKIVIAGGNVTLTKITIK